MDKWDEVAFQITTAVREERPEAALQAATALIAELGRSFERIAVALEHGVFNAPRG